MRRTEPALPVIDCVQMRKTTAATAAAIRRADAVIAVSDFLHRELEAKDVKLPVIEAHVRYLRPAHYDDLLEIRTRVEAMTGARVSFAYEVYRSGESKPLATATTAHAVIDSSGRARRVPEEIRSLLA